MGKFRKILALILVLCTVLLCTACTKEVTFREYNRSEKYEDPYPLLKKVEKLDELTGMYRVDKLGELFLFSDEGITKVYNAEAKKIVAQFADDEIADVEFFYVADHIFFAVDRYSDDPGAAMPAPAIEDVPWNPYATEYPSFNQKATVTDIYNAAGTAVVTGQSSFNLLNVCLDMFSCGSTIYRVNKKGAVSTVSSSPFSGGIPALDYQVDSYYYTLDEDCFTVYDKTLTSVFFWEVPNYDYEECTITPLGKNVLVQLHTPLPSTEAEYDYLVDGEKYDLTSLIIDPTTGKVTSAELDYILLYSDAEIMGEPNDGNHATVFMIENKRVQTSDSGRKYVTINEKTGKLTSVICTDIYGQTELIAKDRYLYHTYSGDTYLIDSKGNTIGKVNALGSLDNANETFFLYSDIVYNYDLKPVADLEEEELSLHYTMGHSILLEDEFNELYLLKKDGTIQELDHDSTDCSAFKQFYALLSDDSFDIFNEDGTLIGEDLQGAVDYIIGYYGDAIFICASCEGEPEYYRLFP